MRNNRKYRKQLKLQLLDTLWWGPLRKKMTPFRQLIIKVLVELFIESKIQTSYAWPAERHMVKVLYHWIHGYTRGHIEMSWVMMVEFSRRMSDLGYVPNNWWEQYVIAEVDVIPTKAETSNRVTLPYLKKRKVFDPNTPPPVDRFSASPKSAQQKLREHIMNDDVKHMYPMGPEVFQNPELSRIPVTEERLLKPN
jgi:hypothetical protein